MSYIIEVYRRDLSMSAEECKWKEEEGHNAQGTGDLCDAMCKSLGGDTRTIRDYGSSEYVYADSDAEEYERPGEWAVAFLAGPEFPDLHGPQEETGGIMRDHAWLSGSSEDPYLDQFTEYSVYLRGDWSVYDRARVFRRVGS